MNRKKSRTIRTKLISVYSVLLLATVGAILLSVTLVYRNTTVTNSRQEISSTCQQVVSQSETYFNSIRTLSSTIQSKLDGTDVENQKTEIKSYFDNIIAIQENVLRIGIFNSSGELITASEGYSSSGNAQNEEWFTSAVYNPLIDVFSRIEQTENKVYSFALSKYCSYNREEGNTVLKVDLDFSSIINNLSSLNLGTGGHVVIYDKNYNLVYASVSNIFANDMTYLKKVIIGETDARIDSHSFYIYASTITNTTWRMAIFANTDYINNMTTTFLWITSVISIAVFILSLFIIIEVSNSISVPIKSLQKEMDKIAESDYINYQITQIKGSREIEDLSANFNSMMQKINDLMEKYTFEQNQKRLTELKALQNQINPHFLYNTLDSIIYLIDEKDNQSAHDMVVALAKFFRISMSKGRTVIPVKNEIEHVRNYLIIQKMRYKEKFSFTIEVQEECYEYNIIKLILQPIAENCLLHGLKEKAEEGKINIKAYIKDEFLYFEVSDNGFGILPEKIQEIRSSFTDSTSYQGIGLKNVFQRLTIYYGEKADVIITSVLDEGTTITLKVPLEGARNVKEE